MLGVVCAFEVFKVVDSVICSVAVWGDNVLCGVCLVGKI